MTLYILYVKDKHNNTSMYYAYVDSNLEYLEVFDKVSKIKFLIDNNLYVDECVPCSPVFENRIRHHVSFKRNLLDLVD